MGIKSAIKAYIITVFMQSIWSDYYSKYHSDKRYQTDGF